MGDGKIIKFPHCVSRDKIAVVVTLRLFNKVFVYKVKKQHCLSPTTVSNYNYSIEPVTCSMTSKWFLKIFKGKGLAYEENLYSFH